MEERASILSCCHAQNSKIINREVLITCSDQFGKKQKYMGTFSAMHLWVCERNVHYVYRPVQRVSKNGGVEWISNKQQRYILTQRYNSHKPIALNL